MSSTRILFAALPATLALTGCVVPAPRPVEDLTDRLTGTWSEFGSKRTCDRDPATITFTPDSQFMMVERNEPYCPAKTDCRKSFRYQVVAHTDSNLWAALEDEPRMAPNGEPVVWRIMPLGRKQYC